MPIYFILYIEPRRVGRSEVQFPASLREFFFSKAPSPIIFGGYRVFFPAAKKSGA